jgi:hypothetical protein
MCKQFPFVEATLSKSSKYEFIFLQNCNLNCTFEFCCSHKTFDGISFWISSHWHILKWKNWCAKKNSVVSLVSFNAVRVNISCNVAEKRWLCLKGEMKNIKAIKYSNNVSAETDSCHSRILRPIRWNIPSLCAQSLMCNWNVARKKNHVPIYTEVRFYRNEMPSTLSVIYVEWLNGILHTSYVFIKKKIKNTVDMCWRHDENFLVFIFFFSSFSLFALCFLNVPIYLSKKYTYNTTCF